MTTDSETLQDLIGGVVTSFEEVQDYYYLVLDRAYISLYNPLLIPLAPESWGQASVGSVVTAVESREDEWLSLSFSNGTRLTMSLRPEVYVSPEAALFWYREGSKIVVIR